MAFVYVDAQFDEHPRVLKAGEDAALFWFRALCWSSRNHTGGYIPTVALRHIRSVRISKAECVRRLVAAGLWTPELDGWRIVQEKGRDYPQWKLTRTNAARIRRGPWLRFRELVSARDGHRCVYCGATQQLTLDHIIPRSRGGPDEPENLAAACRPCNSRKHTRTPDEAGMVIGGWR